MVFKCHTNLFFLSSTILYESIVFRLTLKELPNQLLHVNSLEAVPPILTTRKKPDKLKTNDFPWTYCLNEDAEKKTTLKSGDGYIQRNTAESYLPGGAVASTINW